MTVLLEDGLKQFEAELPVLEKHLKIIDWHAGGSAAINGAGNDMDIIMLIYQPLRFGMLSADWWEHCRE